MLQRFAEPIPPLLWAVLLERDLALWRRAEVDIAQWHKTVGANVCASLDACSYIQATGCSQGAAAAAIVRELQVDMACELCGKSKVRPPAPRSGGGPS